MKKWKNYLSFVVFSLLFSVFIPCFISENTSAASVTCDLTSNLSSFSSRVILSNYCDFSSLDSSVDWYWYINVDLLPSEGNLLQLFIRKNSTYGGLGEFYILNNARVLSDSSSELCSDYTFSFCVSKNPYSLLISDYSTKTNNYHFSELYFNGGSSRWIYLSSFSLTVSDSLGSSGITPTGNIDITENGTFDVTQYAQATVNVPSSGGGDAPYTGILEGIKVSILTCGAIIVVLYFFYCFYRIIIRSTGGKQ